MRKTIGNISKKDYLENIKVFNDIEIPDRFSNYTISLDSIFKDVSFATFYKRLIRYQTLLNNETYKQICKCKINQTFQVIKI